LTVLTFAAYTDKGNTVPGNVVSNIMIQGVGTNVPGTTESGLVDPIIDTYAAGSAQCSLHSMTVVVKCVDPVTAAAGRFYMGAAQGRINRTSYATFNALGNSLTTRREIRGFTASESMNGTVSCCAAPLDPIEWSSFGEKVASPAASSGNVSKDSLTPVCIVFAGTASAVNYVVEVFTEWRVIYNTSIDLASTQTIHPSTPNSFWDGVRNAVAVAGGTMVAGQALSAGLGFMAARAQPLGYMAMRAAPLAIL